MRIAYAVNPDARLSWGGLPAGFGREFGPQLLVSDDRTPRPGEVEVRQF
jgi:hypothetical protein